MVIIYGYERLQYIDANECCKDNWANISFLDYSSLGHLGDFRTSICPSTSAAALFFASLSFSIDSL